MNEQRKPIFGFLWAKPDPLAPVDAAYRQERRVRVTPRGPIRLGLLLAGTTVVVVGTGTAVLAGLEAGWSSATVLVGAVAATLLVVLLRGWVVGTYVNDDAVTIECLLRRAIVPWSAVESVDTGIETCPFLGFPARVGATRATLVLEDGTRVPTHVYGTSPDLWLRPEALDMAALRLARWLPPSR